MKKYISLAALVILTVIASAQTKKVSILGDSYSTFQGVNPEGYAPFYPNDKNDVTEVGQTWWSLYISAMGYELDQNNSWGGTTICNTGYGGWDMTTRSFNARYELLGNPDIIFVFGGTNDAWANSPIGEYQYADWTDEDCKAFRPALACLLVNLQSKYPEAKVYALLNSELKEEINESCRVICGHYAVPLIELHDIEKQNGHPSINGMKSICNQLIEAIDGNDAFPQTDGLEPGLYAMVGETASALTPIGAAQSNSSTSILGLDFGESKLMYKGFSSDTAANGKFIMVIDLEQKAIKQTLKEYDVFVKSMTPDNIIIIPLDIEKNRRVYSRGKTVNGFNTERKERVDFTWEQVADNAFLIEADVVPGEYAIVFRPAKLGEYNFNTVFDFTVVFDE